MGPRRREFPPARAAPRRLFTCAGSAQSSGPQRRAFRAKRAGYPRTQKLSFTPTSAGTYTATFTVTDKDGGVGSDSAVVTVTTTTVTRKVTGFVLVNSVLDSDIRPLHDNDIIIQSNVGVNLTIRADTSPITVGSVRFALDGNANFRVENFRPYALFGDNNGDYFTGNLAVGTHTLTATPFALASATGAAGTPLTIHFLVIKQPFVSSFTLVNADTGASLGAVTSGSTLNLSKLPPRLSIRAETFGSPIGSVLFNLDGSLIHTENFRPYSLNGDFGFARYVPVTFTPGKHTLSATPFSGANATGKAFTPTVVMFMVVAS
jgi:hypothetical protein